MTGTFRVLIADDHAPTRAAIRQALEEHGGFEVCAEVADAASAVEAAVRQQPDLCLLDVEMPGGGIEAAWEIASRLLATKVVMLAPSTDDEQLLASLRAGATGYLVKDIDPDRLPVALEHAMNSEAALPRALIPRLIAEFRDEGPRRRKPVAFGRYGTLTSREWQVLDLLGKELSTAQIAKRLVISQATVRSHVASILRKLRVPDREGAVRLLRGLD